MDKEKIEQLLKMSEEMFTWELSKKLYRYYRTIKKKVENKNMLLQDERKLKWVMAKLLLLTNAQIFEKAGIERVKKDKRCRILCELVSVSFFFLCVIQYQIYPSRRTAMIIFNS